MKRQPFYVVLMLYFLLLTGCSKSDDINAGEGVFYADGRAYAIHNVSKTTTLSYYLPHSDGFVAHYYMHKLHFTSTDGKSVVTIWLNQSQEVPNTDIHAVTDFKTIELTSGEYSIFSYNIHTLENSIQSVIHLRMVDDDEDLLYSKTKMNFSYKRTGDIFEIELDNNLGESIFSINWKGPVKKVKLPLD